MLDPKQTLNQSFIQVRLQGEAFKLMVSMRELADPALDVWLFKQPTQNFGELYPEAIAINPTLLRVQVQWS